MADLNNSAWSETDASNTSAPPAGWPAGMFPNQVEPTAQAMMGALKRWWNRVNGIYTSAGAAGIYNVTPSNPSFPTAYVDGERYTWKAHQTSQGGDTLNWNGLGARPLYKLSALSGAVAIGASDIVAGQRVDVVCDNVVGGFILMSAPTASTGLPPGLVMPYAGGAPPPGWLLCYGQAVSRTTYVALFNAITTTYGAGDGSTTFNLPDLRGRVAAGVDAMGGGAANRITSGNSGLNGAALGAAGGTELLHGHTHGVNDPTHNHQSVDGSYGATVVNSLGSTGNVFQGGSGNLLIAGNVRTTYSATGITLGSAGGGASQNVQPTLMLNYVIKT